MTKGIVVYAGVDYGAVLNEAQEEAQILLWDGGNNDFSFFRPDLEVVVLDPHRAGQERLYHPGEVNLLRAHILVINKMDSARPEDVARLQEGIRRVNARAQVIRTASRITVTQGRRIAGKRVLVVEDGPTLTHGGMSYGAGTLAARQYGASKQVDPRPYAVGSIRGILECYPHLKDVLPAEGYFPEQLEDLEATIRRTPCDWVLVATPVDLSRLIRISQPVLRVTYAVEDWGDPTLAQVVGEFVDGHGLRPAAGG